MATPQQRRIIRVIHDLRRRSGLPPTVREIGEAVGLKSTATVHRHLEVLRAEGWIRWDPDKMRSIQVISKRSYPPRSSHSAIQPHDTKLAAGKPAPAGDVSDMLLPREQVGDGNLHQVWIKGDSMSPVLCDGDLVIFREQDTAIDGDMVVARFINDATDEPEFTVKWYRLQDGHARLIPENPIYEPIDVSRATAILGKVVAYTRRL